MLVENYACEDELGSRWGGREMQKKKNIFHLCLSVRILNEK